LSSIPTAGELACPCFRFLSGWAAPPHNNLILRDSRISRNHAQIARTDGRFVLEDLGSRHGVWVNGERVDKRRPLEGSECIEFCVPDGYQIHFTRTGEEIRKFLNHAATTDTGGTGSTNLEKLGATLEVARSLQSSFSTDDVLNTVIDAALAATGAERGFLLLFNDAREVRSARSACGVICHPTNFAYPAA
jgi:sigma-B regulation protein RsbU (phosphoserine phosphatase)